MRAKTILANRRVQPGCRANRLIEKEVCRVRPTRSAAGGGRSGRAETPKRPTGVPVGQSKLGWGPVGGGNAQEPMGLPCIVMAAGRPFPPPRARPVFSGVVDFVGYAPVFSAATTGVYSPQRGAELS